MNTSDIKSPAGVQWKKLIAAMLIPLFVGALSALITRNNMEVFEALNKPPLSPPGWMFPVAWTVLYILMGIASYLVAASPAPHGQSIRAYGLQLFFNFIWPLLFFGLQLYLPAFFWLVILWLMVLITTMYFAEVSKPAAYMMIPYMLWLTFASYLNLGIWLMN